MTVIQSARRAATAVWLRACGVRAGRDTVLLDSDPADVTPARRVGRRVGRNATKLAMSIVGAALILMLSMGPALLITGSAPARAELFNSCTFLPSTVGAGPTTPFDGTASLLPRIDMGYGTYTTESHLSDKVAFDHMTGREIKATATDKNATKASSRTGYELFGTGLSWTMVGWGSDGRAQCSVIDAMTTVVSNIVLWLPRITTDLTIKLKEYATGPSPLAAVYTSKTIAGNGVATPGIVANLSNGFLIAGISTAVLITGMWILTKARQSDGNNKRTLVAGAGWSVICAIVAVGFLANGNWFKVVQYFDDSVSASNSAIAELLFDVGNPGVPCELPEGAPNRGLRLSSCAIYDTSLFQMWTRGEFGPDGAEDTKMQRDATTPVRGDNYDEHHKKRSFWQWAGCESIDDNGFELVTDGSSWFWTSDETEKVIMATTCIPGGGFDKGAKDGCTVKSTLGHRACDDLRMILLSIIGSTPYDYVRVGDHAKWQEYLEQTAPLLALLQDADGNVWLENVVQHLPEPRNVNDIGDGERMQLMKTPGISAMQLIAFTNWVGDGGSIDPYIRGENGVARIGLAFVSLILSLMLLILTGYLSILVLLWHMVTLMMVLILPIVALFAMPPPGMKIGIWWLREFASSFVLRWMYGVAITLVVALVQIILGIEELPLGMRILVMLIALTALWTLIKEIRNGSLTPNIGGEKAGAGNKMTRGIVVGAAAVGYMGVRAVRNRVNKIHDAALAAATGGASAASKRS